MKSHMRRWAGCGDCVAASRPHAMFVTYGVALLGVAVVLLATPGASAQTLPELARHVANEHPRIRLLRSQLKSAQFDLERVIGASGLRVSTFVEPGHAFTAGGSAGHTGDVGARARYPLYDWGKASAEAGQATARLEALEARVEAETVTQWLRLSDAYTDVLRQSDALAVTEMYVGALTDLRDKVKEIVRADRGRQIDLRQVESRLEQVQLSLLQRKTQSTEALILMRTLLHIPSAQAEPLDQLGNVFPPSVEAALERLDRHPALVDSLRQVREAEQTVALARAQEKPQIDFQATIKSRDEFNRFRAFRTTDLRIVSQWDMYDGGAAKANTSGALERINAASEQVRTVRRDLDTDVGRSWARQMELGRRGPMWRQQITFATQLREAFWEQFRSGRRSLLDLLSAENDIYSATVNESVDRYDYLQTQYKLFIQLGLASDRWLTPAVGGKVN
jgi:adhesin transport system outer membrane protein